ncbi:TIR domain-containing protein [Brevibacillus agri]|uniref:TIR domain-containing protein n=1 Tax=Brevibacillus agri TaxID=51101 RepID=UPI0030F47557
MPLLKTYDLFISHAWKYNEQYYKIVEMLDNAPLFNFRNYSVPKHDPLVDPNTDVGKRKLIALLDKQVKPVNCVLIIAGMYVAHRFWLQTEIDLAEKYNKPIVGIKPWGQERVPLEVQNAADIIVGWNTESIVKAIRTYSI